MDTPRMVTQKAERLDLSKFKPSAESVNLELLEACKAMLEFQMQSYMSWESAAKAIVAIKRKAALAIQNAEQL
jgi:hypothetical protein